MPVPKRKGMKPDTKTGRFPPLTLGPNSVVDVPESGEFNFEEPKGTAIAGTQNDIEKLEAAMDRVTLSFLTGGESNRTATEALLDAKQAQATLQSMSERKKSAIEQIFSLWVEYTGEPDGGSIEINQRLLQPPASFQDLQIILDAMGNQISRKLGLTMLQQRNWIPEGWDLDEELALTEGATPNEDQPLATPSNIQAEAERLSQSSLSINSAAIAA